jgi:hypothetical protein
MNISINDGAPRFGEHLHSENRLGYMDSEEMMSSASSCPESQYIYKRIALHI